MKKRALVIGLMVIAAGLAALVLSRGSGQQVSGALTVYGHVDIREVALAFRVGGRVGALHFDEGQAVRAGDLLAELDDVPYREQLRQAEAEVAQRQAGLDLLRSGFRREEIAQARARLDEAAAARVLAAKNLARQRELDATRAGIGQELDNALYRDAQAEAALATARAQLDLLLAGYRPEEIAQAEAALALAEARRDEARTRLEDTRLAAPAAGTVRTRAAEPGAIVAAGAPVFVLSLQENAWVRAYVPESRLGAVVPGMRVEVYTDARPGAPYPGRIGFISPTAEFTPKSVHTEELRTSLVYRFRVILDAPDAALRQGMPVTVRLPGAAGD